MVPLSHRDLTRIRAFPLTGGADTRLGTANTADALEVDNEFIYFREGSDVSRMPVGGGDSQVLASFDQPSRIAIDESFVYVGDATINEVYRLPKPAP